jgi:HAE1 family hydrophobic/amphiphilic exporter-1
MVGGLLVSQALTLFTTPVIYIYLDRVSSYLTGTRPVAGAQEDGAGAERSAAE